MARAWRKTPPAEEGAYLYRDAGRSHMPWEPVRVSIGPLGVMIYFTGSDEPDQMGGTDELLGPITPEDVARADAKSAAVGDPITDDMQTSVTVDGLTYTGVIKHLGGLEFQYGCRITPEAEAPRTIHVVDGSKGIGAGIRTSNPRKYLVGPGIAYGDSLGGAECFQLDEQTAADAAVGRKLREISEALGVDVGKWLKICESNGDETTFEGPNAIDRAHAMVTGPDALDRAHAEVCGPPAPTKPDFTCATCSARVTTGFSDGKSGFLCCRCWDAGGRPAEFSLLACEAVMPPPAKPD